MGPWWFVPVPAVIGPEGILEMSSFDEYSVLYPVQFLHYIPLFAFTVSSARCIPTSLVSTVSKSVFISCIVHYIWKEEQAVP